MLAGSPDDSSNNGLRHKLSPSGAWLNTHLSFSDIYAWFQALVPIVMFPLLIILLVWELKTETSHLNVEVLTLILIILFLPFVPYLTDFQIFGAKGSFDEPEFVNAKEEMSEGAAFSDEGDEVPNEDEFL